MGLDGGAGELLELVSEDNEPSGRLVPRSVCHAQGLLHRTVYVLLTRNGGEEVLLQQRHSAKAIYGGCWDVSVAEHCEPHESYENAAARGLCEELRVAMSPQALRQVCTLPCRVPLPVLTTCAGAAAVAPPAGVHQQLRSTRPGR
jgi:isopentenyldiphosphate isomerase